MPFRTFKREYKRTLDKWPGSSILACILFKEYGISTVRLKAMLEKYEQSVGTKDVSVAGAERVFKVGLTVLSKEQGTVIREPSTGYFNNVVMAFASSQVHI